MSDCWLKSVFGRFYDRPSRHRFFFLVSLCLKANGEMVPKKLYTILSCLGVLPFVHVVFEFVSCVLLLVLSCLLCNCCWLTVYIVVVVLCVLLSYMYLLYCVGIAFFLL